MEYTSLGIDRRQGSTYTWSLWCRNPTFARVGSKEQSTERIALMETTLTEDIKSRASDMGADLVGVAPVERFQFAPEETNPGHYLPTASSVISIGIHIADGVIDIWGNHDEPGKSAGPYLFYGYGQVNMELGRITHSLAKELEKYGYRVVIFPPTWGVSVYRFLERLTEGVALGDFSHRHAAVAAGLGEIGWHGLCMTPKYGTRVRWCSVITDAPLAPDPLYAGPRLCRPAECGKLCVRGCPTRAFSTQSVSCRIGDRVFEYSKLDKLRCYYGIYGYMKGSGGRSDFRIPEGQGTLDGLRQAREEQDPWDQALFRHAHGIITGDFCVRCLRECPTPSQDGTKD